MSLDSANACGPSSLHGEVSVWWSFRVEGVEIALPSRQSRVYFRKHSVEDLRVSGRAGIGGGVN